MRVSGNALTLVLYTVLSTTTCPVLARFFHVRDLYLADDANFLSLSLSHTCFLMIVSMSEKKKDRQIEEYINFHETYFFSTQSLCPYSHLFSFFAFDSISYMNQDGEREREREPEKKKEKWKWQRGLNECVCDW